MDCCKDNLRQLPLSRCVFISCTVNSSCLALMVRQEAQSNTSGSLGKFLQKRNWERDDFETRRPRDWYCPKPCWAAEILCFSDGWCDCEQMTNEWSVAVLPLSVLNRNTLLSSSACSTVIPTEIETLDIFKYWMLYFKRMLYYLTVSIMQ